MKPIDILPPGERGLLNRIALFFRMQRLRKEYEKNCPASLPVARRLLLDFSYLELYWSRIAAYQDASGLESANFTPAEQFYRITVLTEIARQDVQRIGGLIKGLSADFGGYERAFRSLAHELNPFEFAERCGQCHQLVADINATHFGAQPIMRWRNEDQVETAFYVKRD